MEFQSRKRIVYVQLKKITPLHQDLYLKYKHKCIAQSIPGSDTTSETAANQLIAAAQRFA